MMIRNRLSVMLGEMRWTQADLARRTGIRPSTINEIYHELTERINLEYLDRICEVLGCDISDLLIRIPNEQPGPEHNDRTGSGVRGIHCQ